MRVPEDERRRCSVVPTRTRRCGRAALALAFWASGLALMGLPFLRARAATQWNEPTGDEEDWTVLDPGRNPELDIPFAVDVRNFDRELAGQLEGSLEELIEREVEHRYGIASASLQESSLIELRRLPHGRNQYLSECAGCHGRQGDGGGPAARQLAPRPRNFWKGMYKFRSTGSGQRPTRRDLYGTIQRGLAGSAMPEFKLMSEERLWDIVEYVRWLAIRGEFRQKMIDIAWDDEELPDPDEVAEIVEEAWNPRNLRPVFPATTEPPFTPESVARGHAVFLDRQTAQCFQCHGDTGKGDGPNAEMFTDDWGYPIRPRDFTLGVFRAGEESRDLYQTIYTGIGGTPMGSYEGVIESEDMWHVVHFIQSLAGE
jgi:mono/diheme cytochrome c family protein